MNKFQQSGDSCILGDPWKRHMQKHHTSLCNLPYTSRKVGETENGRSAGGWSDCISPPCTYCGLDMFGPFIIKERQSEIKRYGILFTCLNSRAAIHIEVDTNSFILALQRFIACRRNVRFMSLTMTVTLLVQPKNLVKH